MPPPKTPTPRSANQDSGIVVELLKHVDELRADFKEHTNAIGKKIDDQSRENRADFKELREDVFEIKARLAEGSERIRTLRRDVDGQKEKCDARGNIALEKKCGSDDTKRSSKPKLTWWAVLIAGGALAWVGERGVKFVVNGLADPPPAQAPATPGQH